MFVEITPHTWSEAKKVGDLLSVLWIFRGHSDATWQLATTIERAAEQFRCSREYIWIREKMLIRDFQRRAHHYIAAPPAANEILEWLVLVQHHGGPTRLLDFTHSFYIAAFFAIESALNDACVWAISKWHLDKTVENLLGDDQKTYPTLVEQDAAVVHLAESFLRDRDKSLDSILNVTPNRLNERIAIQQGTSLFPCNTKKSFESNLCAALQLPFTSLSSINANSMQLKQLDENLKYEASVVKINLPRQLHRDAYLDLHRMNIDEASLFPGLDGFARSLKYHLRVMEPLHAVDTHS